MQFKFRFLKKEKKSSSFTINLPLMVYYNTYFRNQIKLGVFLITLTAFSVVFRNPKTSQFLVIFPIFPFFSFSLLSVIFPSYLFFHSFSLYIGCWSPLLFYWFYVCVLSFLGTLIILSLSSSSSSSSQF